MLTLPRRMRVALVKVTSKIVKHENSGPDD